MEEEINTDTLQFVYDMLLFMKQDADENPNLKDSLEVAIECIQNAFEVFPDYFHDIGGRDVVNLASVVIDDAEGNFLEEDFIGDAEEFNSMGNELGLAKLYPEAVEQYTKALKLNPYESVYFHNRAVVYSYLENYEECIQDCEKAVSLDPIYGKAYARMGMAFCRLGEFGKAYQALLTASELEPNNNAYRYHLSVIGERMSSCSIEDSEYVNDPELEAVYDAFEMEANPELYTAANDNDSDWGSTSSILEGDAPYCPRNKDNSDDCNDCI